MRAAAGSPGRLCVIVMTRRTERVNEVLREELSNLLREELNDPRIGGIVTITHVDVSPDLRRATAYVSVLGSEAERGRSTTAWSR